MTSAEDYGSLHAVVYHLPASDAAGNPLPSDAVLLGAIEDTD